MGNRQFVSLPVFGDDFPAAARAAVADDALRSAVLDACLKKDDRRRTLLADLPDADGLRELAGRIKAHTLEHLDHYLQLLETNVQRAGGQVHYADSADDANRIIVAIARQNHCKLIVKSKSMATEETRLNDALTAAGLEPVETDLGELIIQLAGEHPSHMVMPAIHMRARQIGELFARVLKVPFTNDPAALAETARRHLRQRFENADMGVSGVNFAVAETGSIVICTNEGNGRMCTTRPRVHVALMGLEKVIPRLSDLPVFLKLLARSASGQPLTQYTNIITGPRRPGEHDGPEQLHLVILDNGRARILASRYRDTLRCIRCGACLNACPVYRVVGGHTYGSVYPGPIGALLTPLFNGLQQHPHLPQATSLCGACYEACPVKIDIPRMLIEMRRDLHAVVTTARRERFFFRLWTRLLSARWTYVAAQRLLKFGLRHLVKSESGWVRNLPGPARGWTQARDFPVAPAKTFRQLWKGRR